MTRRALFEDLHRRKSKTKDPLARLLMQRAELVRRHQIQREDYVEDPEAERWFASQLSAVDKQIEKLSSQRRCK